MRRLGLYFSYFLMMVVLGSKFSTFAYGVNCVCDTNGNVISEKNFCGTDTNKQATCMAQRDRTFACTCLDSYVSKQSCTCGYTAEVINNSCLSGYNAICIRGGRGIGCECKKPGSEANDPTNKNFGYGSSQPGTLQLTENKGTVFCWGNKNDLEKKPNPNGEVLIYTALGCVPGDMNAFIKWLLPPLFGFAGGISFLLMVFGFIKVATSAGDPKEIEGAKETITSALIGLVVSIFALFILKLVLVGILKIPGIS